MPPEHRRLLIIDDEDDIREVASLSLEMTQGWIVAMASSGPAGIALATSGHPDAILLDVMMPDLDGPSTLRLLQSGLETAEIPVIFLTAKVKEADRRKYLDLGARAIIAKPFDPLTLGQQISDALGWVA
jgi:CheY-like chemotaxis protein